MKKTSTRIAILGLLYLALTACGASKKKYEASDVLDQTVQGTHNGTAFTLGTAVVSESAFDPNELSVKLYGEVVDPCDDFASTTDGYIMFSIAKAVGEYPLQFTFGSDSQTVTFYVPPGSNTIASQGIIVIDSIDGTEITMGLVADAGDDFSINGTFTTAICP